MARNLYRLFIEDFERQYELTANFVAGVRDGSETDPELVAAAQEAMSRFLADAARRFETLRQAPDSGAARELAERLQRQAHVYGTPGLPKFECNYITDQVIVGRNPLTAHDVEWLRLQGVTAFVDLREAWEWKGPGRHGAEAVATADSIPALFPRRHVEIVDDNVAIDFGRLQQAVMHLDEVLAIPSEKVYIHCRAGQERTAAVLIAYFASRRWHTPYEETLSRLRRRRPALGPRPAQEQSVRQWLKTSLVY